MLRSTLLNPGGGFCKDNLVIFRTEITVFGAIGCPGRFPHLTMFGRGSKTLADDLENALER
jgi:hypothetical protein